MAPQYLNVQEANGTKVSLLDSYQNYLPYGYNSTTGAFAASSNCNSHQHDQFVHDPLCQSQRRLADRRSSLQRHQQLLALAADARNLSHRDPPAAKHEHQESLDERKHPLHRREHEPGELLRAVPGLAGSEPLDRIWWQRERQARGDGHRLRGCLAGYQNRQPRRTGELQQRSSAGNRRGEPLGPP